MAGHSCVELSLEPRDRMVVRRAIGTTRAERRHDAEPQLPHDLFPDGGILGDAIERGGLEHQTAGLQTGVMTRDAVLIDCVLRLRVDSRASIDRGERRTQRERGEDGYLCPHRQKLRPLYSGSEQRLGMLIRYAFRM